MPSTLEENRILELEKEVVTLRINEAHLIASVENLTKGQVDVKETLKELNDSIKILNANMNKGKGALWAIGVAATIISGAVSLLVSKFSGG